MGAKDRVVEQTKIRHQLLANGYVPLANLNKMCVIKGWTKLEVDKALIEEWSGQLSYQTTGLRVDAPLVAVDIDINDRAIVDKLWDWAVSRFGPDWAATTMIRGRDDDVAKECWVFKVDEPFSVASGPRFIDPAGTPSKVEVFASNHRQIGAYGTHTPGERLMDEPLIRYVWLDDAGPADIPVTSLHELTKSEVMEFIAKGSELMEAAGWERVKLFDASAGKPKTVYDLELELELTRYPGVVCTVADLQPGDRVRMAEILGDPTNTNLTKGSVYATDRGTLMIFDHEEYVAHMLVGDQPEEVDTAQKAAQLADKLRASMGSMFDRQIERVTRAEVERVEEERAQIELATDRATWDIELGCEELEDWECMGMMVANLCTRYVYFSHGKPDEQVVDVFTGRGLSVRAFELLYKPYVMTLETETPTGRPTTKAVNPAERWSASSDRIVIDGYQFIPGDPQRLIETPDGVMLNIYRPASFLNVAPGGGVDGFYAFMDHLLPNVEECEWLLDWIAYKLKNPQERGAGVVLVDPQGGTGKGVLFRLLMELVGPQWYGTVAPGVMLGTSSQAAFEDAFINKTLVATTEIKQGDYRDREKAYERLKYLVDPASQMMTFSRKGLSAVTMRAHYSWIGSTNHVDALPIPAKDRRFAVLSCTTKPLTAVPDVKAWVDAIAPWGSDNCRPEMIRAIYDELLRRAEEVSRSSFVEVPITLARQTMIEDTEGDVEEYVRRYIGLLGAETPCFWFEDMVARCLQWMKQDEVAPAVRQYFKRNARNLLRGGFEGWSYPNMVTKWVDTKSVTRYQKGVVRHADRWTDRVSNDIKQKYLGDGPKSTSG